MADKSPAIDIDDPYRQDDYDFGVLYGSAGHKATWTDGLPRNFQGWGPKTPDPATTGSDSTAFQPEDLLSWAGEADEHTNHHVWHFDGRRRHH